MGIFLRLYVSLCAFYQLKIRNLCSTLENCRTLQQDIYRTTTLFPGDICIPKKSEYQLECRIIYVSKPRKINTQKLNDIRKEVHTHIARTLTHHTLH